MLLDWLVEAVDACSSIDAIIKKKYCTSDVSLTISGYIHCYLWMFGCDPVTFPLDNNPVPTTRTQPVCCVLIRVDVFPLKKIINKSASSAKVSL